MYDVGNYILYNGLQAAKACRSIKEKDMQKPIAITLLMATIASNSLIGCKSKEENAQNNRQAPPPAEQVSVAAMVADGFDLSQLPGLVKQAQNADELERIVNESGVNNLDMNKDGNIDYINVEETRNGNDRGFALFTNENNQRIDIAQVSITQTGQNANVNVAGNPNYYGPNVVYRNSFPLGEILLMAWLFDMARPRYFHSPYYYGRYPTYYRSTRVVPRSTYQTRVKSLKTYSYSGSGVKRTTGAATGTRSLSNVEGKSFSTTTNKRPPATTGTATSGFGSTSSRTTTGTTSTTNTGSGFGTTSARSRLGNTTTGSTTGSNSSIGSTSGSTSGSSFGSSSTRSRSGSSFGSSSGSSSYGSSSSRSSFGSSSSRSSSSRSSGGRRRR
jgi:hypothetical protein